MIDKIGAIEVIVSNFDKAIEWYKNTLGARITEEYHEWKCVELLIGKSKIEIDLGQPDKSWGSTEYKKAKSRIGTCTGIIFETSDINKTYQELKSKGVKFTTPPNKRPWGEITANFIDLDGNEFKLVESK